MFQQIMVPLDGSELAERALPSAIRLAAATGATLHLVRVVESLPGAVSVYGAVAVPDRYLDPDVRAAAEYLDALRVHLAADGLRVQTHQRIGHVRDMLLQEQRTARIDLMVMCSHGRGGLARFALGSVADHLVRHGEAPVLLVRACGDAVTLEHGVVPLDGSARAEEALPVVEMLTGEVLREVTLLRVIDAAEQGPAAEHYLAAVAQRLHRAHLVCRCRVVQGDAAAAISATAGPTQLVVMATHGRSELTRWALGSVADRVLHGGGADVLLVRAGVVSRSRQPDDTRQPVGTDGACPERAATAEARVCRSAGAGRP